MLCSVCNVWKNTFIDTGISVSVLISVFNYFAFIVMGIFCQLQVDIVMHYRNKLPDFESFYLLTFLFASNEICIWFSV